LGIQQNRTIFPIIVVAVGLLFLAAAVVSFLLLRPDENQINDEVANAQLGQPQVSRVNLTQAKGAYDAGSAVFVDVRDKVYYDSSHIPGALSIPLNEIEQRLVELDPNDWLILY
jgi:hypothetical protein